jgi:hypothetical protein
MGNPNPKITPCRLCGAGIWFPGKQIQGGITAGGKYVPFSVDGDGQFLATPHDCQNKYTQTTPPQSAGFTQPPPPPSASPPAPASSQPAIALLLEESRAQTQLLRQINANIQKLVPVAATESPQPIQLPPETKEGYEDAASAEEQQEAQ